MTVGRAGVLRGMCRLLPMALLTVPFGIGFGIAAVDRGMTATDAVVMSMTVFSGTAQFAALDLWRAPAPLLSLVLVVLALNARLIVMGATLAPWLNPLPLPQRLLLLTFMSDPNYADSRSAFRAGELDAGVLLGGGLVLWLHWMAGTAIGAIAGRQVPDLERLGFDVVMLTFFAAVAAGQLRERSAAAPALVASGVALLGLGVLPPGLGIVAGAVAGALVGGLARDATRR